MNNVDLRLAKFFTRHPECAVVLKENPELVDERAMKRFVLEVSRGRPPQEAAGIAKKRVLTDPRASVSAPKAHLHNILTRFPEGLPAGAHEQIGEHHIVNLSSSKRLVLARTELEKKMSTQPRTTLVCDPGEFFQVKREDNKQIITLDAGDVEQSKELSRVLKGPREEAGLYHRQLLAWGHLPSEHALRVQGIKDHLVEYFVQASFFAREPGIAVEFDDDIANVLVEALHESLKQLAEHGRVVLPVKERNIYDLAPITDWEGDDVQFETVVETATNDDDLLSSLAAEARNKRIAYWGVCDPKKNPISPVNGLLVPRLKNSVFLKLLPEVMEQVVYFSDVLDTQASFCLPARSSKHYRSVADGDTVGDLFATKCLMQFMMVDDASLMKYLRGWSGQLAARAGSSHPLSYILTRIVAGDAFDADGRIDEEAIRKIARVAATLTAYRALANPDGLGCIGALYCGPTDFACVERVELEMNTGHDFVAYYRNGVVPDYIRPLQDEYKQRGVELVLRPPADSNVTHVLGMAELFGEEVDL